MSSLMSLIACACSQILKMVAMILYLMHVLGCFWFFVATNSGYEGTIEASDTWRRGSEVCLHASAHHGALSPQVRSRPLTRGWRDTMAAPG